MNSRPELPYAHGGPSLRGRMRATPEDFEVEELLAFEPTGQGEHAFLRIEKRGANTAFVARELARLAGVGEVAIGYAGLKDRHAVARQYFTVHLPGRPDPDWNALSHPEFRVLSAQRHSRKLPRGALAGNRFRIVLREVSGPRAGVEQRVADVARRGVPNYFGEQRFGMRGDNVEQARAMFAGQRVRREQRSLLLSAARAEIFNAILAERVARDCWDRAVAGDVFQLDGSHSIFGPEPLSDKLEWRLGEGDIHPTGALWGRGELRTVEVAAALEADAARAYPDLAAGLEAAGLKQERRALRLRPAAFSARWLDDHSLALSLELGAGSYATAVLREICRTDSA